MVGRWQLDLGLWCCRIWRPPTTTVGSGVGSSRSHSRGWWCHCMQWAWHHWQLWWSPAVVSHLESNLSGSIFLKVASGRVMPCAPLSIFRIRFWTLGLLVSFMSTVMNNSSFMTSWMTSWHHWRSAHQCLSHHLLGQSWCCILFWFLYCSHADVRMVKSLAASGCPLLRLSAWTYISWAQGLSFPYECILTCKLCMFLEHECHHSSYMCLS